MHRCRDKTEVPHYHKQKRIGETSGGGDSKRSDERAGSRTSQWNAGTNLHIIDGARGGGSSQFRLLVVREERRCTRRLSSSRVVTGKSRGDSASRQGLICTAW